MLVERMDFMRLFLIVIALAFPVERAAAQVAQAERKLERSIADLRKAARKPLDDFLADPGATCASRPATLASLSAMHLIGSVDAKQSLKLRFALGSTALEIAEGLNTKGCAKDAREIYDLVIATFLGTAYAALRQRALVGIADLPNRSR